MADVTGSSSNADIEPKAGRRSSREQSRHKLVAVGAILGGLAASSCCILPLVLFSPQATAAASTNAGYPARLDGAEH